MAFILTYSYLFTRLFSRVCDLLVYNTQQTDHELKGLSISSTARGVIPTIPRLFIITCRADNMASTQSSLILIGFRAGFELGSAEYEATALLFDLSSFHAKLACGPRGLSSNPTWGKLVYDDYSVYYPLCVVKTFIFSRREGLFCRVYLARCRI